MKPVEIARKILKLHRQGEPLNISAVKRNHPQLLAAAYACRPFLGWKQAVDLAGLDYQLLRVDLQETVECLICGYTSGNLHPHLKYRHGINAEEYRREFPSAPILPETFLAGKNRRENPRLPHWEPLWTYEYLLDRAWQWKLMMGRCNQELIRSCDPSLSFLSYDWGNGWDEVLTNLGLDPSKERRRLSVDPEMFPRKKVVATLRNLAFMGKISRYSSGDDLAPELVASIRRHFTTINHAFETAGLLPPPESTAVTRKFPTSGSVLAELRNHRDAGLPLHARALLMGSKVLVQAIILHFGSYAECLAAGGISEQHGKARKTYHYGMAKYESPEAVLAALRQRAEAGLGLRRQDVLLDEPALVSSCQIHFRTYTTALAAADLLAACAKTNYKQPAYPSAEAVIAGLRQRHAEGLSLSSTNQDNALYYAARKYFPSWEEAISAAGLAEARIAQSHRLGGATLFKTPEDAVAKLRELAPDGVVPLFREVNAIPQLRSALYRFFDGVGGAAAAAGLRTRHKNRTSAKKPGFSKGPYPDKASVIAALRRIHLEGGKFTSSSAEGAVLYNSGIRKHFGKLDAALEAAGLTEIHKISTKEWYACFPTPESVILQLRSMESQDDQVFSYKAVRGIKGLLGAMTHHFGLPSAAVSAAFPDHIPGRPRRRLTFPEDQWPPG
ncbi:MAG: hypothetical protein V4733_06950 [Verrucomicrobiota bacterium]